MSTSLSGGCACGAIRYESTATPLISWTCHCRDCQRASGGAYCPVIYIPQAALIITGESRYYEVQAASGRSINRGFCGKCGSPVFVKPAVWPDALGVWAGSLDDPSRYQPVADIWTASAQPWDTLTSLGRKFAQGPTEEFLDEFHLPRG